MKITLPRVIAVAFLAAAAPSSSAEIYQCESDTGCVATVNTEDGLQKKALFRKGDIISTGAGWIVNTEDGWTRLRQRNGDN